MIPKTTTGRLPLIGDISVEIAAEGSRWLTQFFRGGELIAEDRSAASPWTDRRATGRLTVVVKRAVNELDKTAIREAIEEILTTMRESPDSGGIVSEPVARVIGATRAVTIELSEPPIYQIDLEDGKFLTFAAKEIAAHRAITLNEKWLSAHPREPLNAVGTDFETIIADWLSIAEESEPFGNANVWESVVERLQIKIAPITAHGTRDGLVKSGLYQEPNGPLWIAGRLIAGVLKECGRDENDSGFSKHLLAAGILVQPSKPIRVGRMQLRAWGLSPDIKPDDSEVSADFTDLAGEEVRP